MESVKPANEESGQGAAAVPQAPQFSTPDPHEATKPVRIGQSQPAGISENAQPEPTPAAKLEDTKPVQIRTAATETSSAPAPTQGAELPAWLIAFAAQEMPAAAPVNPEEDTRSIPVGQPETAAVAEPPFVPVSTPTDQAFAEASGWAVESLPEQTIGKAAAEELENLPGTETNAAGEDASEPSISADVPSGQQTAVSEESRGELAPESPLAKALDEGRYSEAAQMLKEMAADSTARAEALRVLRPRLHLRAESQPLWQFYADLCGADEQPTLAKQALETAERLKNEAGDEHGTIAGIG